MKRSEINRYIREALEFWEGLGFKMPPYARWSREEWQSHAAQCQAIFDLQIGWDVTSFGSEDFLETGLLPSATDGSVRPNIPNPMRKKS